jgi:hypothetical protein
MTTRGLPDINLSVNALRGRMNRGAVGSRSPSSNIGAGANMRPQRTAGGGATAGLSANPSRV